jgi:hypothetical protein
MEIVMTVMPRWDRMTLTVMATPPAMEIATTPTQTSSQRISTGTVFQINVVGLT